VKRLALTVCMVVFLLGALPSCERPMTVDQQIIATILEMERTIEAGERRAFLDHVSEDFSGQNGVMNRDRLRGYVLLQLNRYKRLQAQLFPIDVEDRGDGTAAAWFRALVTGGAGWIPESGQMFEFETHWRLEDGEWLLQSAHWEPVPLDEVL
jgi:hypothetical protein